MKIVISAGDPSGDIRCGELLRELNCITEVTASGLGGDRLIQEGADVRFHLNRYSVMGFAEILRSLPELRRLRSSMRSHILETEPDLVLLVDYPGFNIPMARWAKKRGYRVIYYISPQLWAWGAGRVRRIRDSVDLMITLFKFEVDFYREHGVNAVCAGHPLADAIREPMRSEPTSKLALLPGSRGQEVSMLLEPMAEAFRILKGEGQVERASVAVSPGLPEALYEDVLERFEISAEDSVKEALEGAAAAAVCSGTATLETSMWGVPFIVSYRTSLLTYLIARLLVRGVRNIGMANLVAQREFFREFIQGEVTPENLAAGLRPLITGGPERDRALEGTVAVREALGPGESSRRAAEYIVREMNSAEV